ncbi:MAG: ABC transporter permease [Synergistaceae bacterium]
MIKFIKRKSFIAFIVISTLGIFAPLLTGGYPHDVVGAPFSRPIWWNRSLSKTTIYRVTGDQKGFEWNYRPPAIFAVEGKITPQQNKDIKVFLVTPKKEFLLDSYRGNEPIWLNIDSRDMIFKQKLGLSLIGKSTNLLFNIKGKYFIKIENAQSVDIKISLYGQRHGLLGTDQRGRDVFTLLLYGIRTSLIVGISATIVATLLGLGFGIMSGYLGGIVDTLIMRAVDVLMSIPTLPILMILAGVWGKGLWQLVFILSIFSWMGTARSVRSLLLSVRESVWVEGLCAMGASKGYILTKHLIPETAPILLANLALGVPGTILSEAGLAFLGLSDPRLISWGRMLHEAHSFGAFTEGAWWLLLPPGFGIVAICLICLDMGRFLEEKIDPRLGGD